MSFLHLEPFLDHATESLRAGLDARIDAINAETGDFDLEKPAADAYIPGGSPAIIANPTVEIAAPDWRVFEPSLGNVDWDAHYVVMVRVWYQHVEFDHLYRALMRYGRAVVEVLSQPEAFGPGISVTEMRGAYRVNPETNERVEFEGGALVVATIQTVEVRP